VTPYNGWKFII